MRSWTLSPLRFSSTFPGLSLDFATPSVLLDFPWTFPGLCHLISLPGFPKQAEQEVEWAAEEKTGRATEQAGRVKVAQQQAERKAERAAEERAGRVAEEEKEAEAGIPLKRNVFILR